MRFQIGVLDYQEKNKKIYDILYSKKDQIESDFQGELAWKKLENNKASKIECRLKGVNISRKEDWGKITEFFMDSSIKMHAAFSKYIPEIRAKIK